MSKVPLPMTHVADKRTGVPVSRLAGCGPAGMASTIAADS